ncbi:MAG: BrnA antitoxin family protein [Alphaproteobacteria bacterium]|nr:MAG: BrnA antitoxin family protein [Alphaproteobacteria bacterium]
MNDEPRRPPPPPDGEYDENPEWTEEDFANARPASEVLGPEMAARLMRQRGRPAMAAGERKEAVSIRLSPDVLAHFRATGDGWQTRIDEALRGYVAAQRI